GVVGVDRLRAVGPDAGDGAAGGVHRPGEVVDPAIEAQAPVVGVVVVEQALAVISTAYIGVGPTPQQHLVGVLHHQVPGGGVDVDALGAAALARLAEDALCAKDIQRGVEQAEAVAGDDRSHVSPVRSYR